MVIDLMTGLFEGFENRWIKKSNEYGLVIIVRLEMKEDAY